MYESMYKFWEMVITLDCEHVILVTQSGGQGHTGDSGHVSLGTVFMEECHTRHCGNVSPGPGSRGCHPEYCGLVTPGGGSSVLHYPRDYGHVTPGVGSVEGCQLGLWTCYPRCRFWKWFTLEILDL